MQSDLACPVHADADTKPYVDGASDQFFGLGDAFAYKQCTACGALVLDPRPSPNEIGPYYARYYPEKTMTHLRRRAEQGRRVGIAGRLRAIGTIKRLEKLGVQLGPEKTLLDVGCGLGGFARYMRQFGELKSRGVDFSDECKRFAKDVHDVDVDTGELRDQKYEDGTFDFVTSWHYLEHVYDPAAELKEMARILKPGGWLICETPTNDVLAKLFAKRWLYLMPPTHLYHYRPDTMRALVEDGAGLKIGHLARPWFPGELAGSLMLSMGLNGFVPKVFGPGRPFSQKLLTVGLLAQMVYDVPVTLMLAFLGRSGLMRVYAQKPA